jgi:hypothetical protein
MGFVGLREDSSEGAASVVLDVLLKFGLLEYKVYPFGPLYHFGTTFFILPFCSRNRKDKRENHKQGNILQE